MPGWIRWLASTAMMHYSVGDLDAAIDYAAQGFELLDQVAADDREGASLWVALFQFRAGVSALVGSYADALADADTLDAIGRGGPGGWTMRWVACMIRGNVHGLRREYGAAVEATGHAVAEGRHRTWAELLARAMRASALVGAEDYETALSEAITCIDAEDVARTTSIMTMGVGAFAAAALGRFDAALDLVGRDHGPMLAPQRCRHLRTQITGLASMLYFRGEADRLADLKRLAIGLSDDTMSIWSMPIWGSAGRR